MRIRRDHEIGYFGRIAGIFFGLMLVSGLGSGNALGLLVGVVGVAIVLAGFGLIELAMAIHYRLKLRSWRHLPAAR